jgi:hypothetical protein
MWLNPMGQVSFRPVAQSTALRLGVSPQPVQSPDDAGGSTNLPSDFPSQWSILLTFTNLMAVADGNCPSSLTSRE